MVEVRRSTILHAPLEQVWEILRDFNGHESWHPAVAVSRLEEDASGDLIGAVEGLDQVERDPKQPRTSVDAADVIKLTGSNARRNTSPAMSSLLA